MLPAQPVVAPLARGAFQVMSNAEQLYHIGLRAEHETILAEDGKGLPCPAQYLIVGGVTFHRFTQKVEGYGAETTRHPVKGGYAYLSKPQIERIKTDLDRLRVQWLGRKADGSPILVTDEREGLRQARARIVDVTARGYRPIKGELTLHGWLFMQESATPELYQQPEPPSLVGAATSKSEPDTQEQVTQAMRKGSRSKG